MWRDLECRLTQAEISAAAMSWVDWEAAHHRRSLRAFVELHELIREGFRAMGIHPALAVTLRCGEKAAAELAAIPDTPELKATDEAIARHASRNGDDGARQVWAKIGRMAEQYRAAEHRLDPANASPAELLAFGVVFEMERRDTLLHGSAGWTQ